MMSWQAWAPPDGWPANAPSVRWQDLSLGDGHEARLWLFDLDEPSADKPELTGCLSQQELERAGRLRQPLHGRRNRVARAMLRHLLAQMTKGQAAELTWQSGPHGKPHLAGHPALVHFNLSHSGAWALLATSASTELGVDIEALAARAHLVNMASRILCPEERACLERVELDANDTLLTAWVRKEACLKALGTGLIREMDTVTLGAGQAQTATHARQALGEMPSTRWRDVELPPDCPSRAAIAWLGHPRAA